MCGSFVVGFYYCKNQVAENEGQHAYKEIERIAIVNLDTGVVVQGEKQIYSSQLLNFASDYAFVGLNEAKQGIETDAYAAYIVIPTDFSECIESVNGTPVQASIEYILNPRLNDENRLLVQERLNTFKELLNSNTAYVYLNSVLREFHAVQDSSNTIMAHDQTDLNNILSINPEDIFNMIEFSEMQVTDNKIKDVTLTEYISTNTQQVDNIFAEIDSGIQKGQVGYQKVEEQYSEVSSGIANVQNILSAYDSLKDANGNNIYQTGLDNLEKAIDEYNDNVDTGEEMGVETLKNGLGEICSDYTKDVLKEAQKTADEKLERIQEQNGEIISEQIEVWQQQQSEYYDEAQTYMNNQIEYYNKYLEKQRVAIKSGINYKIMQDSGVLINKIKKIEDDEFSVEYVCDLIAASSSKTAEDLKMIVEVNDIKEIRISDSRATLPNLSADLIVLPTVEKLYVETVDSEETDNATTAETVGEETDTTEKTTTEATICIDVDKDIDIENSVSKYVVNKEDDIRELLRQAKAEVDIEKTEIVEIINTQIIGEIEKENQKDLNNYTHNSQSLLVTMQAYSNNITSFDPYDYISIENITKYENALSQNIKTMENSMNTKNAEYFEYINTLTQNTNENIDTLQKDMQTANAASKKKLNEVITELKTDKETISTEDDEILGAFANKLPYTRMGSLEYTEMQKFMVSPVGVVYENEENEKADRSTLDDIQLEYQWIAMVVIGLLLTMVATGMTMKLIQSRKELKLLENEE